MAAIILSRTDNPLREKTRKKIDKDKNRKEASRKFFMLCLSNCYYTHGKIEVVEATVPRLTGCTTKKILCGIRLKEMVLTILGCFVHRFLE